MRRRDFLKTAASGSLILGGVTASKSARAEEDKYTGPLLLTVQASGGWDVALFCDGKTPNKAVQLPYATPMKVSGVTCSPFPLQVGDTVLDHVPQFFTDLGARLLVLNGIDTQTNSHAIGSKHVWSGQSSEQIPTLAALFAASHVGQLKLAAPYMSLGGVGYDANAGIVQVARLNSTKQLSMLASPNALDATGATYHGADVYALIQGAVLARQKRALERATLPFAQANLSDLISSRAAGGGLKRFADRVSASPVSIASAFPALKSLVDPQLSNYLGYAQTALLAFSSGVSVSANLTTDNVAFDTHSNHDERHSAELGRLLLTLRYVFQLGDQLGLSDRLYVIVGSDFGRTPTYNAQRGKDHWNVTSMLMAGPKIRVGRVVGGTDDQLRPLRLDPTAPDKLLASDDPKGVTLLPEHIHRAFRRLTGIAGTPVVGRFPLSVAQAFDAIL